MKIVAIGGGNNSDIKKNGNPQIYEQELIDKEIILLTNKSNPNVLFVSHASDKEFEFASYNKIVNTYGFMYSCPVKLLSIDVLKNNYLTKWLVDWADIIYIGGGNTRKMIELWKQYNFDELLKTACLQEKVLCGISAGANCWFSQSCSDYLQMESNNPNAPYVAVDGLCMIDLIFNPHANYKGRLEGMRDILKEYRKKGLSLSNNMAIEIVDDEYKLIKGISSDDEEIFATLGYWKNGEYYTQEVQQKGKIKQLTHF